MAHEGITAYPLCWPRDWKRTTADNRERARRYKVTLSRALDHMLDELRKMGASDIVLSSNIPARLDGRPYADASAPKDPGVAVYWVENRLWNGERINVPKVIACDKWTAVHENVHAIGLAIAALRALQRSGASEVFERANAAFGMLPMSTQQKPWWEVLGLDVEMVRSLGRHEQAEVIEEHYLELAKIHHPDTGGDTERMAEVNHARDEAVDELGL